MQHGPPIRRSNIARKKTRKNDSKMRTKIYRFFQPILKRFLMDFPPILDPKISKSQPKSHAKSKQKIILNMTQKNQIWASKWIRFFTFLEPSEIHLKIRSPEKEIWTDFGRPSRSRRGSKIAPWARKSQKNHQKVVPGRFPDENMKK